MNFLNMAKLQALWLTQKAMERLAEDSELRINMGNAAEEYARSNYEQNKLFELLKKHRDALICKEVKNA